MLSPAYPTGSATAGLDTQAVSDSEIIAQVCRGELAFFEVLMRRYNRRIFRVARSILRNEVDAEDAAQEAWIAAYKHLGDFEGRAAFSTWLTRITVRCALAHAGRRRPVDSLDELDRSEPQSEEPGPEVDVNRQELSRLMERAIDRLPPSYRVVIMLRDVESASTLEAADALGVSEESVRVRLHRARTALRKHILEEMGGVVEDVFPFAGLRCDRIVVAVMTRLRTMHTSDGP